MPEAQEDEFYPDGTLLTLTHNFVWGYNTVYRVVHQLSSPPRLQEVAWVNGVWERYTLFASATSRGYVSRSNRLQFSQPIPIECPALRRKLGIPTDA